MEDQSIKILTKILEVVSSIKEEQEEMKKQINLNKEESEKVNLAKKIVDEKRYITKNELFEKLGLKNTNWRVWQELLSSFSDSQEYNIHSGVGRAPTIIVSLKNHNSAISLASKVFKDMEKNQEISINLLQNKFKDEALCKEIINMITKMFPERIEKSKMLPIIMRKIY